MLRSIFFISFVFYLLCGCSGTERVSYVDTLPLLVEQTTFRPIPPGFYGSEIVLVVKILVTEEGKVSRAILITPLDYSEWDSSTVGQILKWKFNPATLNGKAVPVWVRQSIRIQVKEQLYVMLAEIVCETEETADSVFRLLKSGDNFSALAKKHSVNNSAVKGGSIGEIDIRRMPFRLQKEISTLGDGEFTKPVYYRSKYYIFKRLPLLN